MKSNNNNALSAKELIKQASRNLVGDHATQELIANRRRIIDWGRNQTPTGRRNLAYMSSLRDSHVGETCVIIGNGPSLNETNTDAFRDIPTFGLNRIYMAYERLRFKTTYNVVVNSYVVDQCISDFEKIDAPLFTTWKNLNSLKGRHNRTGFIATRPGPHFESNPHRAPIWEGATVTYVAMQLAYFMGFTKVILVGVDHRFADRGSAHTLVESTGADRNHFDPNYFGQGFKWQLPDLETSEIAYALAHEAFLADGRMIVDCTVNGALRVFPRMELSEALP